MSVAEELEDRLGEVIDETPVVIVDLSGVALLDSTVLGVLLHGLRRSRAVGGQLRIVVAHGRDSTDIRAHAPRPRLRLGREPRAGSGRERIVVPESVPVYARDADERVVHREHRVGRGDLEHAQDSGQW